MVVVAGGCPLMVGNQDCVTAPDALLRVLKPPDSPLRSPRSCRRMAGGGARHPSVDPGGHPPSSRLSLGDPSRVDFRLVFYPLVTPLRRDDQGLSSDEASGFTSCAAYDRHLLPLTALDGGRTGSPDSTRGFPAGAEAGGFTSL